MSQSPQFRARILTVSCGTSATCLVPMQKGRQQVTIRNQGAFPVYLKYTPTPADGDGLKIDAGGLIQFSRRDGDDTESDIWGIAIGGASLCAVVF